MNNISNPIVDGFVPVTPVEITEVQEQKSYNIKPMESINFYKGTSFRWTGEWKPGRSYVNDEYFVDYTYYEGNLWVCVKSHFSEVAPSDDNSQWQIASRRGNTGVHVGTTPPDLESYGDIPDKILWIDTSSEEPVQKIYSASQVDDKLEDAVKDLRDADTNILDEVALNANAIAKEVIAREAAVSGLQETIDDMDGAYKAADDVLQEAIDANASAITKEVADREAAVSAETKARQEADAVLEAAIEGAIAQFEGDLADAKTAMTEYADNAVAAEKALREGAISALTDAYKDADAELLGKITAETAARQEADAELQKSIDANASAITQEVADRKEAISSQDTSLRQYVDASRETYTIASLYADSIPRANEQLEGVRLSMTEHRTTLPEAVKAGKVILLKVNGQSSAKYVCNAEFQNTKLYISYVDNEGNFISFFIIPTEWKNIDVYKRAQHLPTGGTLGQVLTKTGEGINNIEWQTPPTATYILPFTHEKVVEWANENPTGYVLTREQHDEIAEAVRGGKVVLLRANSESNAVYVCDVHVSSPFINVTYTDSNGHIVRFRYNPYQVPYQISVTMHNAYLPQGGELGQVLTKMGTGIDDVAWADNVSAYTITSFTAVDVENQFDEELATDLHFGQQDITNLLRAVQENKIIIIHTDKGGVLEYYTCAARVNDGEFILQYTNQNGQFITLATNLDDPDYYVNVSLLNSSLPIPESEGQVLTVTNIQRSNARGAINQVYDFEWADAPQGGGSIIVDKAMSDTSENPVQNKVIKKYVDDSLSVYVLPFTHEQVVAWANETPTGYVLTREQHDEIAEAIYAQKVILIPTEFGGYFPCSVHNDDMLYFSWLDNEDKVVNVSFAHSGAVDTANITPVQSLPNGGEVGQVLAKRSEESFDAEWVDAPQGGGIDTETIESIINEKLHYTNFAPNKTLDPKGNILDSDGWNVTNPIAVAGNKTLTFECGGTNTAALCEYDADGNFVDYWGQSTHPRTITTKAKTAYVRMAVPNAAEYDYYIEQNGVKLFTTLMNYNIAEQGIVLADDGETLQNRKGKINPRTTIANVVDENGNRLNEILGELASGGGEGALIYNAPQTLTDEQKNQVAKNIGQPRERLILEWTNEEAEVLQPTAYDAETGYFTTDKMPSWLAEDGAVVDAVVNYADDILSGKSSSKNVVQGTFSGESVIGIKRISATEFLCQYGKINTTAATIPATVDVSLFNFTNTTLATFQLPKDGEASPTAGIKKFHIYITDAPFRISRYVKVWLNGSDIAKTQGNSTFDYFPSAAVGHFSSKCFATIVDMEVWVDYGAEGGAQAKFARIDSNGVYFNSSANLEYYVNPTMHSNWCGLWGYSQSKQCYLQVASLGSRATVRITEIID